LSSFISASKLTTDIGTDSLDNRLFIRDITGATSSITTECIIVNDHFVYFGIMHAFASASALQA
jgi:hypothetical protein